MKLIGYVRVSSNHQAEHGHSLEVQEERIRAYCSALGHELLVVNKDAGISGKSMDNRPGLLQTLYDLAYMPADGIIIHDLNRLTRSVRDIGALMEDYFQTKALVTVQDHIDTSTPAGRLMVNVLITVSQWEREDKAERTRTTLRTRKVVTDGTLNPLMAFRAKHRKIANGQAPYGYRWENKVLVKHEPEQKWVDWMKHQKVEKGLTPNRIAIELNFRQVPARGGGLWHAAQIRRILSAEWNK